MSRSPACDVERSLPCFPAAIIEAAPPVRAGLEDEGLGKLDLALTLQIVLKKGNSMFSW